MSRISKILECADIEELAGKLGLLDGAKKQNGEYRIQCIFHDEKTPSLCIVPKKQMFYCFGCAVGGDSLDLYMRVKGITSKKEAIAEMEDMYGIEELPYQPLKHYKKEKPMETKGYENDKAVVPDLYFLEAIADALLNAVWFDEKGWSLDALNSLVCSGDLGWNNHPVFLFEHGAKERSDMRSSRSCFWAHGKAKHNAWRVHRCDSPHIHTVVITEGETDLISLMSELPEPDGVAYVGGQGASWAPTDALLFRICNGRRVILCGDNDVAGRNFNNRMRKRIKMVCLRSEMDRIDWGDHPGIPAKGGVDELMHLPSKEKFLTMIRESAFVDRNLNLNSKPL